MTVPKRQVLKLLNLLLVVRNLGYKGLDSSSPHHAFNRGYRRISFEGCGTSPALNRCLLSTEAV